MEVILREHVDNLGRRGEVVKVADGYARNYLLPRKLALLAPAVARTVDLLPSMPEEQRPAALSELRLTLERAAGEESPGLAEAAETLRRRLAVDYPEV